MRMNTLRAEWQIRNKKWIKSSDNSGSDFKSRNIGHTHTVVHVRSSRWTVTSSFNRDLKSVCTTHTPRPKSL